MKINAVPIVFEVFQINKPISEAHGNVRLRPLPPPPITNATQNKFRLSQFGTILYNEILDPGESRWNPKRLRILQNAYLRQTTRHVARFPRSLVVKRSRARPRLGAEGHHALL